ncbi:MAG: sulfatase-like hydrolase/transferase [Planctomycetota bacterium]
MSAHPRITILRPGLALAALLVPACGREQARDRAASPSLLLITIDTVRADHLGCYGDARAATPNIDAIAAQGVLFASARTCAPLTLPSHVTMLTGTLPPCHGIHDNAVSYLKPEAVTLAELLHDRGYQTGGFVSAFVLDRKFGLDQGFDQYGDVPPRSMLARNTLEERRGDETTLEAVEWLSRCDPARPFFLWLHLFDAHAPYLPPAPFDATFRERPYDGEIAYVDMLVGQIGEAARQRSALLITAVLADHGESLGEHGEQTHGLFVYDATMHIPWVMSGPGLPAGRRVSEAVRTVDLLPTLVGLLHGDVPAAAQGRDLMPLVRGESSATLPTYMESYYGYLNFRWSPLLALSDGVYKVIDAPRPELYSLRDDRNETSDLARTETTRLEQMRNAARAQFAALDCGAAFSSSYQGTPEDLERLRALGYVGQSAGGGVPLPGKGADPKDMVVTLAARDQAMALITEGRTQEGLDLVRQALARDPNNAPLLEFEGVALAKLERFQEAIAALEKAVAIRPDRIDAQYALAHCHSQLHDFPAALARLKKCLDLSPSFLKAAKLMGDIYFATGDHASAATWYEYFLARWKGDAATAARVRDALAQVRQ